MAQNSIKRAASVDAVQMASAEIGHKLPEVYTFDKIALVKGQVFSMFFYEKGGARNLVVTIDRKDLNIKHL